MEIEDLQMEIQRLEFRINGLNSEIGDVKWGMEDGNVTKMPIGCAEWASEWLPEARELNMSLLNWTDIRLCKEVALGVHVMTWKLWGKDITENTTEKTLPEKYKKFIQEYFYCDECPPAEITKLIFHPYDPKNVRANAILVISVYYHY